MNKAIVFLKYTGAVVIFFIAYIIVSVIAHIGIRLLNFDAHGFWIIFLPYFASFMAGLLSALGGLAAVDRFISTVRLRTVGWGFIGLMTFVWGLPLLGLLLGLAGFIDAPLQSHMLWSPNIPPMLVQTLTAGIAVWKMTATGGSFEK